jgi:hypothetical protein
MSLTPCRSHGLRVDSEGGSEVGTHLLFLAFSSLRHAHGGCRLLSGRGALDRGALCIVPGKFVWTIHVDVVILQSGGNLMDLVALAAFAALNDTAYVGYYVYACMYVCVH